MADAIKASEHASAEAKTAVELANEAQKLAKTAKSEADAASKEAAKALAASAKAAGFAYVTAQAAVDAGNAAAQVAKPANDAIQLGSPYVTTDSAAGLVVLAGQASKSIADQQKAVADAHAKNAQAEAAAAKNLADQATGDAKIAYQYAANAAGHAANARTYSKEALGYAADAAKAASAASASLARTLEYDRRATEDAAAADQAAGRAEGYAKQARDSADQAALDAQAARQAAAAAEPAAKDARAAANRADAAATEAEQAAKDAERYAKEAQEAADRAEKAANAKQIDTGTVVDEAGGSIGSMFYVIDHIEKVGDPETVKKTAGCDGWFDKLFYRGDCTVTAKIRYRAIVDLYMCTAQDLDPTKYTCPAGATAYLGQHTTKVLSQEVTHTITIAEYQQSVDPVDILFGSWIKCAQKLTPGGENGSWGGCAWAAVDVASLFAGKVLRPIADAVRAVDAAAKTGIGFTNAYKALRSLGLSEEVVAGISRVQFLRLRATCATALAPSKMRALAADGSAKRISAASSARCPDYVDVAPSGFGIVAGIDDAGLVSIAVKKGPGTPSGGEMFNAALAHFGDKVKGVKAYWQNGGELSDNLNSFNKAVRSGEYASLEEAALRGTFTGKMSSKSGFTNVEIIELRGMPGEYTEVGVIFS